MFLPNAVRRLIRQRSTVDGGLSDASFRSMVEQGTDVVCHIVDRSFTYVSPSAQTAFGWDVKQMVGTDAFKSIFPPDIPMIKEVFARIFLSKEDKLSRHQVRVVSGPISFGANTGFGILGPGPPMAHRRYRHQ